MAVKSGGKVINISSYTKNCFPHFTSYCASKGGVKMMTRNLSIELAPLGSHQQHAPGAIETPINKKLLNDPVKLKALLGNILSSVWAARRRRCIAPSLRQRTRTM